MRALSVLLLLIGAGTTTGAVIWWANFYGDVIRGTKYTLSDAFSCLFNSSGVCSLVAGVSQLIGKSHYEPAVLWIGLGILTAGFLTAIAGARR
jgi:hypothetical protein